VGSGLTQGTDEHVRGKGTPEGLKPAVRKKARSSITSARIELRKSGGDEQHHCSGVGQPSKKHLGEDCRQTWGEKSKSLGGGKTSPNQGLTLQAPEKGEQVSLSA